MDTFVGAIQPDREEGSDALAFRVARISPYRPALAWYFAWLCKE